MIVLVFSQYSNQIRFFLTIKQIINIPESKMALFLQPSSSSHPIFGPFQRF